MNVLLNECGISQPFDPRPAKGKFSLSVNWFKAIWDTGATSCVITQAVVDKCKLAPTGMTRVYGVHGPEVTETYLVNIYLPNNVLFPNAHVIKAKEIRGADMLIGIDVINTGDFAVTNFNGRTKFSFRFPSLAHIDFVKRHNKAQKRKPSSRKKSRKR